MRDTNNNDGSVSLTVDLESANYPSVFILVIVEIRHSFEDLDKLLPLIFFLIQLLDVLGGEFSIERHAQHGLDPAEPWTNGGHKRNFQLGA